MDLQHALGSSVDSVNYLLKLLERYEFKSQLADKDKVTVREIAAENQGYADWLHENGDD
jgi:hypothetical protein